MTQQLTAGAVPQLTLGWRLKMALGEMSVQAMAEELGVSRATLSRWMGDKGAAPARAYVAQWALITGVPFLWLQTGESPHQGKPDGGDSLPRHDSNVQPAGNSAGLLRLAA